MQALTYTVDEHGLVGTTYSYTRVAKERWDSAQDVSSVRYAPYDAMLQTIREGHIIAIEAASRVRANHVKNTLTKKARTLGLAVEFRVVVGTNGNFDVLARLAPQR